jgi:hypothetical protein
MVKLPQNTVAFVRNLYKLILKRANIFFAAGKALLAASDLSPHQS